MKNLNLLIVAVITVAIALVSCKKDAETGPAGPAGSNGSANAKTIILDSLSWGGGSTMTFDVPQLTAKNLAEDAILEYAYFNAAIYKIPGPAFNGNFILRTFFSTGSTNYFIRAMDWDGTLFASPDSIHQIKLVIIESTTTAMVIEDLDDAGVNPNDYEAVKEYYGITEE